MSMNRCAVVDGRELSLDEFLDYAETKLRDVVPFTAPSSGTESIFVDDSPPLGEEDDCDLSQESDDLSKQSIGEGSRNIALNKHLYLYRASGATDDEVAAEAARFNTENFLPPLDAREVAQVLHSVLKAKLPKSADDKLRLMNERFGLCVVGDKARVLWIRDDESWQLLTPQAFYQLFENQWVRTRGKTKNLGRLWMQHPRRKTYTRIVFAPEGPVPGDAFNLFRGWACRSTVGDCSLFLDHIERHCAKGNLDHAHWIVSWMADLFQQPGRKKGTALVLTGTQGSGKSIIGHVLGKILGRHYLSASDEAHITGRFNAHQEGLLLLHSDEATFAGDHAAVAKLKDFITRSEMTIERKGVDAIVVANHARLLVTSEQQWVVPAALLERRFAVFELASDHVQDHDYFGRLMAQMEAGGYEALLHHLLNYSYEPGLIRRIPNTDALVEQKELSLTPEDGWLYDILVRGYLPGDADGVGECPSDRLYADYLVHTGQRGIRRRQIETIIGRHLKRRFDGCVQRKQVSDGDGGRSVVKVFPALSRAREVFSRALRSSIEWDEPHEWQPDPTYRAFTERTPF